MRPNRRASAGAACAYLVATLLAFVAKRGLQAFVQHGGPPAFDTIAKLADRVGSGMATLGFGLAALALGRLAKKPWSRVYLGEHFVWNVMLGYWIATVTALA